MRLNEFLILEKTIDNKFNYVYHVIKPKSIKDFNDYNESFKKYGLLSPEEVLKVDKMLFKKLSYQIYKKRASQELKKDRIFSKDVIDYLNLPVRKGINASALFFSFLPLAEHHPDFTIDKMPYIQLKIHKNKFKNLTPYLLLGRNIKPITWEELNKKDFLERVIKSIKRKPPEYMKYKFIPHLALNVKSIPMSQIDDIQYFNI